MPRERSIENMNEDRMNDRTRIFKEIVSRQPLDHSKCDQCHYHLNATAVRCMTCKKHFCYECDKKFHLTMPFHRRLLCSSKTLKILQPEEFLDSEDSIIKEVWELILIIQQEISL